MDALTPAASGEAPLARAEIIAVGSELLTPTKTDTNSLFVTGDARNDPGLDRSLFCAGGALSARDRDDYATFMRFGFRSSLKAAYTVHNLGFRCAKDL